MNFKRSIQLYLAVVITLAGFVYAKPAHQYKEYPLTVNFDTAKADLKLEKGSGKAFEDVAHEMQSYPSAKMEVVGYADQTGTKEFNQKLSEQRAMAVRQHLIDHYKIEPSRISVVAFGEERPEATNATKAGRSENRRVIARVHRLEPETAGAVKKSL